MAKENREHYEKPGPPEGHAYGVAAVTNALHGLEFPAKKEDVLRQAEKNGKEEIYWKKDERVNLRVILDRIPDEEFPSMANVVSAVGCAEDKAKEEGQL